MNIKILISKLEKTIDADLTIDDIDEAIKQMKNTAPGSDRLDLNVYKAEEWTTAWIKLLHKGGDPMIPSNYRPISLLYDTMSSLLTVAENARQTNSKLAILSFDIAKASGIRQGDALSVLLYAIAVDQYVDDTTCLVTNIDGIIKWNQFFNQ